MFETCSHMEIRYDKQAVQGGGGIWGEVVVKQWDLSVAIHCSIQQSQ
jgi:hypothetical protein